MTKTVKVFGVGKWNKIEFTKKDVEKLIENTKGSVKAIFAHTSKWLTEKKEPLEIGEFSNLRLQNNDVVAELELNDKGKEYYNDGILKGISAEVTDKFNKIAGLPIGVGQAVEGAEFEESDVMEFEEINNNIKEGGGEMPVDISKLGLEERLDLIKTIGESITPDQKKAIRIIGYEFAEIPKEVQEGLESGAEFEIKQPEKVQTKAEIKEELRLEFEAEAEKEKVSKEAEDLIECTVKELKDNMQILPKHEAEFQEIAKSLDHTEKVDTLEFEEDGKTAVKKSQLQSFLEFSKNTMKSYEHLTEEHEFETKKEKTDLQEIQDKIDGKK